MKRFSDEETKEVVKNALGLMRKGFITGINLIKADKALPTTSVIIHYLQDSNKHLDFVIEEIKKFGVKDKLIVPRFTYYFLDEDYTEKEDFLDEYKNAKFLDEKNLSSKNINEVIQNPKDTIIETTELDLIIPAEKDNIQSLVSKIQQADKIGPKKWMDPVIIVKGNASFPVAPGFVSKDYMSLGRENEEFYSIVVDKRKKRILKKKIDKICEKIRFEAKTSLGENSIVYVPSQINSEFERYIKRNQK